MKLFVLLSASYIFYGWWDWRFLGLIILSSLSDYLIGLKLKNRQNTSRGKYLVALSILINIGILVVFKYYNFFIDSLLLITGYPREAGSWSTLNVILPVGISFYTFQTLSYTIDVYKGKTKAETSALAFFTYVAFFPQLVAGPIERAGRLLPQFKNLPKYSHSLVSSGLKLILWGLFKKVVIADQFSGVIDIIYASPTEYNAVAILMATLLFGFQIYCDFSGYSDIAIGTARLFGIRLMLNFKTPYFASSIRDFWHRWHISLSTWFRDYIYFPLGGNKGSKILWVRNIWLTFIISGLWHGANLTFVLWGLIHGLLYILESLLTTKAGRTGTTKKYLGAIFTFTIVNFCWIFFRAESWVHLKNIIDTLFSNQSPGSVNTFGMVLLDGGQFTVPALVLFFILPFFLLVEVFIRKSSFETLLNSSPGIIRWGLYYLLVLLILFFGELNAAPQFIYFQF